MSDHQRAVLFLRVPPVKPHEANAYEKWYDERHIHYRMDKPDFLGAERYDVLQGTHRYFVLYELSSVGALTSKEYLELRNWEASQPDDSFEAVGRTRPGFERGVYEQIGGPPWTRPMPGAQYACIVGYTPSIADEDAWNEWLTTTHGAVVEGIEGVVAARHFVLTKTPMGGQSGRKTDRPKYVSIYHLASENAASSAPLADEIGVARSRAQDPGADPYMMVGKRVHAATHVNVRVGNP